MSDGRNGDRLKQSRLMSFDEAIADVLVGYGIAVLTQLIVSMVWAAGAPRRRAADRGGFSPP